MAGITEGQLLGRRIERLFVSSPITLGSNTKIYTVGNSPWICPSNAEFISFVSVLPSANYGNSGTISFGTSPGGADWNGTAQTLSSFSDVPAMFFPGNSTGFRPSTYGIGTPFYANSTGFNAAATAVYTIYGWTY